MNPLPIGIIRDFASKVDRLIVVEELDPIIETHLRANGIRVDGGKDLFGLCGELSQNRIRKALGEKTAPFIDFGETVPPRPPTLCPGCPHRGLFYTLGKLGVMVSGDIGCYTLGSLPPLGAIDTTVCMNAKSVIAPYAAFPGVPDCGAYSGIALYKSYSTGINATYYYTADALTSAGAWGQKGSLAYPKYLDELTDWGFTYINEFQAGSGTYWQFSYSSDTAAYVVLVGTTTLDGVSCLSVQVSKA